MKKLISVLISLVMVMSSTVALATTYENSAFIGSWIARGTDGNINARLFVDFCDSERIKSRFETYKNGNLQRTFEIYQTTINDTKAKGTFSTVFSFNNWNPTGTCDIELTSDRIKFNITSYDGVRIYTGIFSPESPEFNPRVSPYNSNVNISINNSPVQTELSPFILKNRTYVPLRGVFEAMGINVEWFDTKDGNVHSHEIRATRGDYTVSINRQNINEKGFGSWSLKKQVADQVNSIDLSEVQPVIINDCTFVPLRVIVESFDTKIDWNDAQRRVEITDETLETEGETVGEPLQPEGGDPIQTLPENEQLPTPEEPTTGNENAEVPEGDLTADNTADQTPAPETTTEEVTPEDTTTEDITTDQTTFDDTTDDTADNTTDDATDTAVDQTPTEDIPTDSEADNTTDGSVTEGTME